MGCGTSARERVRARIPENNAECPVHDYSGHSIVYGDTPLDFNESCSDKDSYSNSKGDNPDTK